MKKFLGYLISVLLFSLCFSTVAFASGWKTENGSKYYEKEDGVRYRNEWFSVKTVPVKPSDKVATLWYYADQNGYILHGGFTELSGSLYYFNLSGTSPRKTFFKVGSSTCYADETGAVPHAGWFSITTVNAKGVSSVSWYYANEDGSLLMNGWHELDGEQYYFSASGVSSRKTTVSPDKVDRYYVDENGALQTGWFSVSGTDSKGKAYTNWYYAWDNGVLARNGWYILNGSWCYFDASGLSYRKRWLTLTDKNKKKSYYYFNEDGDLIQNRWFSITNTNATTGVSTDSYYRATEDGSVLTGGIRHVDGYDYHFSDNGLMSYNRWIVTNNNSRKYAQSNGVIAEDGWFSISGKDSNGAPYTNWFYAKPNGDVYMDGWRVIDGKRYYLNTSGKMVTGWIDDNTYSDVYYCGPDGACLDGWQYLEINSDWYGNTTVDDYMNHYGDHAWFFFSSVNHKKRHATGTYKEADIDGKTYCFDYYGIMQLGWIKKSSTTPAIAGYNYYFDALKASASDAAGLSGVSSGSDAAAPSSSKAFASFAFGEKVESNWIRNAGPDDDEISGNNTEAYYYMDHSGFPLHAASQSYVIKEVRGDKYCFDMFGNSVTGLVKIGNGFYYCGEENGNRKCAIGRAWVADGIDAGKTEYYFDSTGKGITGNRDGKYYYLGRLQKADAGSRYELFNLPDLGKRLLDSSGKIVKGRTVKDSEGNTWVVSGSGEITTYGSESASSPIEPEATTMY